MLLETYEGWVNARGGPAKDLGPEYNIIALGGEVGELLNYYKKQMAGRGDFTKEMRLEVGDILYYLTRVAAYLDYSLNNAAEDNVDKLTRRDEEWGKDRRLA